MKQQSFRTGFYTIGIAALFLVGFLLLVLFGARSYQNTVEMQTRNNDTRALLSYVSARVRAGDSAGAIRIANSTYGDLLTIADTDGYETRIYLYDGALVEEYAAADAPLAPETAQAIGSAHHFSVRTAENQRLFVTTDAGTVCMHLRSEGGVS